MGVVVDDLVVSKHYHDERISWKNPSDVVPRDDVALYIEPLGMVDFF